MFALQDSRERVTMTPSVTPIVKAVMLGDYGVGKTTFFRRLKQTTQLNVELTSSFIESQSLGAGTMDMCKKTFTTADNQPVQVELWDTAGAERYRSLTLSYFKLTDLVILVYRTDSPDSLCNLRAWVEDAIPYLPPRVTYMLIGNRDHVSDREELVSPEMADDYAATLNAAVCVQLSLHGADEDELIQLLRRAVEATRRSGYRTTSRRNSIALHDAIDSNSQKKRSKCSC